MKTFDFILRFDDDNHSLTAKSGLSIKQLSELLSNLYDAINVPVGDKLVLSEIRGNCYALNLTTNNEIIHENLKVVHRKIGENDFVGLNAKQLKYAGKVKSILGNNLYLQAYNEDKSFRTEVKEIDIPKLSDFYFEISSIYGIITSIGGRTLDGNSYVRVGGQNFEIKVSPKQEANLIPHFKKGKLRLILNKKISITSKEVKGAVLEYFEVVNEDSFHSALKKMRSEEFDDKMFDAFNDFHNKEL